MPLRCVIRSDIVFSKILIPTDGSLLSLDAALAGVAFAKQCRAEVIGAFVAPAYEYPVVMEPMTPPYPTEEQYHVLARKTGEAYLAEIREAATAAGLAYSGITTCSNRTARQLAQLAIDKECDLIFMGSHGRSGWEQLLPGSVTAKVLTLCDIPVLVYQTNKQPQLQSVEM